MATLVPHTADLPLAIQVESGIRQAVTDAFLASANLTSQAAADAAIVAAAALATKHVSDYPRNVGARKAVEVGVNIIGSTPFSGSNTADIYAAVPGDAAPGASLAG